MVGSERGVASEILQQEGSIRRCRFFSPRTGRAIHYAVVLPDGYEEEPSRRYPVLVHLHGLDPLGRPWDDLRMRTVVRSDLDGLRQAHERAVAKGLIGPMILAFPDGYADSMWGDTPTTTRNKSDRMMRSSPKNIGLSFTTNTRLALSPTIHPAW